MPTWLTAILPSLLKALGSAFLLGLSYVSGYTKGKDKAEKEQLENDVKASTERKKVDEDVNKLSDDELDSRLSKWVRK